MQHVIPVRHTTVYFPRRSDTQWALQPASICITGLPYRGGWEMQGTLSLDSCPTSHKLCGTGSLTLISLSFYTSSVMKLQSLAVNVDDIRILKAGGTFRDYPIHQQPELRLHLFFPKPTSKPCCSNDKLHGVPKVY